MELEKALKTLIVKDPFYGLFLLNLNKCYSDKVPTLGVCLEGINHKLLVNKEFWDSLTDEQQLAVLKHECGHIMFKHTTQLYSDLHFHEIANMAMDCEINFNLQNLPEGCIDGYKWKEQWEDFELLAGSRYNYNFLLKKLKEQQDQQKQSGGSQIPDCGDGYDQSKVGSHEQWKDFDELSDAEKSLVEQQTDYIVKNTAEQVQKMRGTIPGQFKAYIDSLFAPRPQIFNWKSYFRRLLGTAEEYFRKTTRKKPSKRFEDAPGFKQKHKHKILVAIDTSGSVSDDELRDFFSEINYVYKAGAQVDVLEYDARVNKVWRYTGKTPEFVTGRGGTVWQSAYDWYLPKYREYSAFVTFTDGYDSYIPTGALRNAIFVITSNGQKDNKYPGKTVFIPENK